MSKKTSHILKSNLIHAILLRTLPKEKFIRYYISLVFAGIMILLVSNTITSNNISDLLQFLSCIIFMLSLYLIPSFELNEINDFLRDFSKYLFLFAVTLSHSILWCAFCANEIENILYTILLIPITLIEISLIAILVNYTLKLALELSNKINSKIKKITVTNRKEKSNTIIKEFLANASVIMSFIISLITLIELISKIPFFSLFS